MPLDVLGRTRATLKGSACSPFPRGTGNPLNPLRGRDRSLQLFSVNQEFPVRMHTSPFCITGVTLYSKGFFFLYELVSSHMFVKNWQHNIHILIFFSYS